MAIEIKPKRGFHDNEHFQWKVNYTHFLQLILGIRIQ